jgi:hypothetical protein
MTSKLFYKGTTIEVQLGDKVVWKRLLRRPLTGKVVYIPGISPAHPDLEHHGVHRWAIELEDGRILQYVYCPERAQPKWTVKFVERGQGESLSPNERIY